MSKRGNRRAKRDIKRDKIKMLLDQYTKLTEEEQCKFIDATNTYDRQIFFKDLNMKEPDYSTYKKFLKGARKDG